MRRFLVLLLLGAFLAAGCGGDSGRERERDRDRPKRGDKEKP